MQRVASHQATLMLDDYKTALESLNTLNRKKLTLDLRIHLSYFYQIGFDIPDTLESILVNTTLSADKLTRLSLFDTIYQVNKALSSAIHIIDRFLLDIEPKTVH